MPLGRPALSGFASHDPASFWIHQVNSVSTDQEKEEVKEKVLFPA